MRSSEELIRVRSTKEIAKGIDKRDADAHLGWLKFLYEDYEPRCWWFTVVELLRRLWLTALIALLGSDEELTTATQLSLGLLGSIVYYMVLAGYDPYISRSDDFLGKVAAGQIVLTYFAASQIQMRANADNNEAGDPKSIYDNVVFNIGCVVVGAASAAVGLFLVAADAGKSVGIDCLSLPSRASSADAPEEKEADELEAASPTSPPDIPT